MRGAYRGKEPKKKRSTCTSTCVHACKHCHTLHACVDLVVSEIQQKRENRREGLASEVMTGHGGGEELAGKRESNSSCLMTLRWGRRSGMPLADEKTMPSSVLKSQRPGFCCNCLWGGWGRRMGPCLQPFSPYGALTAVHLVYHCIPMAQISVWHSRRCSINIYDWK